MAEPARRAVRIRVAGRVQGVGFRWSAVREARRLGVRGWVRNADDGSVEAAVEGAAPAVEAFLGWMRRGPSGAFVRSVEVDEVALQGLGEFDVAW